MRGDHVEDAVEFELDGVRFVSGYVDRNGPDRFTLVRSAARLEAYERVLDEFERPRMVELGVAYGGSLAWFALRARPARLVGIGYKPGRLSHLDTFIRSRHLDAVVRPCYGVDQADRDRLREIVAAEFGGEPIDLVVDDASHRYRPTLASFETLFPVLRPGGLYVHRRLGGVARARSAVPARALGGDAPRDRPLGGEDRREHRVGRRRRDALSRLAIEFLLVQTSETPVIDDLSANRHWIAVRRGQAPLPDTGFRLTDHYVDAFAMVRPLAAGDPGSPGTVPR